MKHKIKRLLSLLLSLTMLTAAFPTSIWAEETEFAQATGAEAELPNEPEETAEPELPVESPEETAEPEFPSDPTELPPETETPEGTAEPTPQVTEEPLPTPEPEAAYQAGMFVLVTENTRVFSDVDETADEADGELYDGSFVRTANVRVEEVRQDGMGRTWLLVRYLYGEEEPDGEMAWTDTATVWVMAEETQPSDAADYDVTAYAFPFTPVELYAANNPPRLQTLSGNTGEFYAGQTVYAYSVHDDVQIASLKNYGAIYATRHYINEHVVYCLEHTMNSPGIRNNPDGPYHVVDLAQYGQTQGYSGIIYSEKTMHAIGWVLRHTFPFMGIDRYEDECLEWSRAAGQFAIREVIKQLEGAQYVRDYWHMDEFYRATGQAPKEYLEYARWLAANALTYAQMTGEITVSNVSVSVANGVCTGTATLTTDAPRIRIRRSVGTITGYTGGEDGTYVYLNSGDTITVSQAGSGFSFTAESVSTEELEANFLVAVPDANVQKVVIPQRGEPYPLKSTEIRFDMPNGALVVTKTDAASGAVLAGATFELTNASGTVVATQTTGADGAAHFDNLPAGNYTVREINAPTGYLVAVPDSQSVTVTAGETTGAAFTDERIRGRIRIAKTDSLTKEPLAGAEFTITRTDGTGTPIVLTTDVNGNAETDWLDYGRYRVTESKVPAHYETSGFSTEIDCTENRKTYLIEVENEPTKGFIQIVKTDALDGRPIEGVQFDIVDAGGNVVGTMTTDASGAAMSPALFKGQYTVREHENPTGYVAELAQQDAAVNPDETTYLGASNQPIQGRIRIVKRDQLTKELLAGAEFTVTRISGLPSHQGAGDGEVVAVITTDAEGVAETGWLTWGIYRVTESKVPEHFVDTGFSVDIVIDEENFKTCELEVENEPTKGFIRLTKTDRANGNPIAGVKFDIYENDEYGNALVGSMTTGADGVAISEPLRKGRYIVREHGATKGYVFEEIALDATVKPDETTDLAATNQPVRVKIRIYKRDKEDDEDFKNPVDLMFEALEEREPEHFAVRQYKKYKLAAGKTAKSILISCAARLAPFDIAELRELTAYDELELDALGNQKSALFIIISDTDDTFNFLVSLCYTQLFNLLCEKADDVYGGRLPVHVRCLIDECANIGQIPRLEKLMATIRSREISACLVLQTQSQLKAQYKDSADTICGNCDSVIFLGGKEKTTLKELSKALGRETIDTLNTGESRGRETSRSTNFQKLGKELMSVDELAVMDGRKCILQLRGVRPFLSDKYDITQHPNYKYLSDADSKNTFDIERFLKRRLKLKSDEQYDVFEVNVSDADE